jgi:hypothetical protein
MLKGAASLALLLCIATASAALSNTIATTIPTGMQPPANVSWIAGYCNATSNLGNIGYNYTWYLNGAVNSSGVYSTLLLGNTRGASTAFHNESGFTNPLNANDSNYSTFASYTSFGQVSLYWNYTRPANSTNVTKWQVKHGTSSHVTDNTTLTAGCANQTIIQLKITANNSNSTGGGAPANSSKNGTAFSDGASVGTITWSNPTYANKSDNIHSNASITAGATTHYLNASNFGFAIPSGATITGIQAAIEKKSNTKVVIYDVGVYLLKADATTGTNMKNATVWGIADATTLYGGSTNLWGTTWTPAEINAATFGLVLSANNTGARSAIASVDYINLTVFYNNSGVATNYSRTSKFCMNDFGWTAIGIDSNATNNFSASDIYEQDLFFNTASGGNTSGQQVMMSNITPTITAGQNWILQCTAFDSTTENYNSSALVITNCGCGILATPNYVCEMDANLAQSASCFLVQANNVTIRGNGFSITGTNAASTWGIRTTTSNTTIQDVTISNFPTGILASNPTTRMSINNANITATGTAARGIEMYSTASNLSNIISTVNGSSTGSMAIVTSGSTGNRFTNITVRAVGTVEYGFFIISGSNSNTFTNINSNTTTGYPLYFDYSNDNNVTNLTIKTSSTGTYFNGATGNTIDCQGGTIIGGNTTSDGMDVRGANTTIRNCNISNFAKLISCTNAANLSMDNLTVSNTRTVKEGIMLTNCHYSTLTNSRATATYYALRIDTSNFTRTDNCTFNTTGAVSTSAIILSGKGSTISNTTAICKSQQTCAWIYGQSGATFNEVSDLTVIQTGTAIGSSGFQITHGAANNTATRINASVLTGSALQFSQATNNTVKDSLFSADSGVIMSMTTSNLRNLLINNTFISGGGAGNLTSINAGNANNTFCLNNFTATTGVYINDKTTATTNNFNCTYEGKNQGNIYFNVMNGSVPIVGTYNSSITGLYIGHGGTGFPYSNATTAKVIGKAVDYAPLTPFISSCTHIGGGNWTLNCTDLCTIQDNVMAIDYILYAGTGLINFRNVSMTYKGQKPSVIAGTFCTFNWQNYTIRRTGI